MSNNQVGNPKEWLQKANELARGRQFKQLHALISRQGGSSNGTDIEWARYWLTSAPTSPYLSPEDAFSTLEKLVNKGDVSACIEQARCLLYGTLCAVDTFKAEDILRKYADVRPQAKLMLASLHEGGFHKVSGTQVNDVDEAIRLYDEIANLNDVSFNIRCEAIISSCRLKLAKTGEIDLDEKVKVHSLLQKLFYSKNLKNDNLKRKVASLLVEFFVKEIQGSLEFLLGHNPSGMREKIDHEKRQLRINGVLAEILEDVVSSR